MKKSFSRCARFIAISRFFEEFYRELADEFSLICLVIIGERVYDHKMHLCTKVEVMFLNVLFPDYDHKLHSIYGHTHRINPVSRW